MLFCSMMIISMLEGCCISFLNKLLLTCVEESEILDPKVGNVKLTWIIQLLRFTVGILIA